MNTEEEGAVNVSKSEFNEVVYKYLEKEAQNFFDALHDSSDRSFAIVATCWIDALLERLLKAWFIKDAAVPPLFKDDHILQTYHARVSIAYASGLIPKFLYSDLRLLGEVRNRFAHNTDAQLSFAHPEIAARIERFVLKSETLDKTVSGRVKFSLVATQIGAMLAMLRIHTELLDDRHEIRRPMDVLKWDEGKFKDMCLTRAELVQIVSEYSKHRHAGTA